MSGVNDRLTFLSDTAERRRELEDRYGLTTTQFQALRETPGSAVCSITARQPKRPQSSGRKCQHSLLWLSGNPKQPVRPQGRLTAPT